MRKCDQTKRINNLKKYELNPTLCKNCNSSIALLTRSENGKEYYLFAETRKRIFCSSSCSASFNNLGVRRHGHELGSCLNCGKTKKRSKNVYCSNSCHHELEWKKTVKSIQSGRIFSSYMMKKYLISVHGEICQSSECGWDWSKKCSVELEHIIGDLFRPVEILKEDL